MPLRIEGCVVRGEIDNRMKGRVRGRLWIKGAAKPFTLDLKGNAAPDLAGCLLTFEYSGEAYSLPKDMKLNPAQKGDAGEMTASRKVRVSERSWEDEPKKKKKKPARERMANSLYLEWYSEANGRVVIESSEFKLTISAPAWKPTEAEEKRRVKESAENFKMFIQKLSDKLDAKKHQTPEDKEWDEFDYEKFMRECDARTDKYGELLDKYMDHPDRDRIVAKEMGWERLQKALDEKDQPDKARGESSEEVKSDEESEEDGWDLPDDVPELVPDPATEGVDWVRDKNGHIYHPLVVRARESSVALWRKCDELGLKKTEDEDLVTLITEFQTTGAKLAGALDGLAYDRGLSDGAFIVAYLKRALGHLHAAQAGLERVVPKKLVPAETLATARKELFEIREEILRLMQEFRGKG